MDRAELANVLRAARARIIPEEVGLSGGRRRRVAGLRREEVAQLAGLSVDYVVRLEQGRAPRPSIQVLTALTQALRLDRDERDQVFRLAGSAPPLAGRVEMSVRPSVLRLLQRMTDLPQRMRLHRLHQRRKHIPALPRRLLKICQAMPVMRFAVIGM